MQVNDDFSKLRSLFQHYCGSPKPGFRVYIPVPPLFTLHIRWAKTQGGWETVIFQPHIHATIESINFGILIHERAGQKTGFSCSIYLKALKMKQELGGRVQIRKFILFSLIAVHQYEHFWFTKQSIKILLQQKL